MADNESNLNCRCTGKGECYNKQPGKYSNYVKVYECSYKCELVECRNYLVCGNMLPESVSIINRGLCDYCMVFIPYYLEYKSGKCRICKKTTTLVNLDNVDNNYCYPDGSFEQNRSVNICIECFKDFITCTKVLGNLYDTYLNMNSIASFASKITR
jgi:hypothetical protein